MNEKNYKRIEQETVQRKNVEESTIQRYFAINVEILASRYTASSAVNGFHFNEECHDFGSCAGCNPKNPYE